MKKGEKRKKIGEKMWCEGEVVEVPNDTTDTSKLTTKCKKLVEAGAVRIKWPEDTDFDEPERCIWTVLKPKDFGEQVHLGWRYAASSIERIQREREQGTPETRRC